MKSLVGCARLPLAGALLLGACGGDPPRPASGEVDPALARALDERDQAEHQAKRREAELLRRIDALESDLATLRAERDDCQGQLGAASTEAERYQQGLGRAVDELNRVASSQRSAPASPSASPRAGGRARVSTLSAPWVQITDQQVTVTGKLWNAGDADALGSFTIELLRDGEVIDSAEQRLDVPARTDYAYSQTFSISPRDGTYSARVRLDY